MGTTGFVVSFMDVRSAQKAHSAEPKFQGHQLRIAFHEQSKKIYLELLVTILLNLILHGHVTPLLFPSVCLPLLSVCFGGAEYQNRVTCSSDVCLGDSYCKKEIFFATSQFCAEHDIVITDGLVNPTAPSNATGLGSPQNARNASSGSTTTDSHRRSSDQHSPNSSSSKQIQKERQVICAVTPGYCVNLMSQHRLSSSSRRQSRERERDRERGNSSRTDERSQRSRISGNNDRRTGAGGGDSRTSRRSRHSPRASASSDSSRDSASPRFVVFENNDISKEITKGRIYT
ncbi:unnamed protein product [Wuchereria bancrofti]|uniref:Uncharacterized protein n=2 Tax=Onchocercidae TaxID=6296 RepID=A0A3P7EA32_WUCBA|nr:unnamed protein product [Wuchereria bancrofti]